MNVKNNPELDIAVGNSRKTKTWKNKSMLWSEILDRLERVTRTPETVAEYKAMGRTKQSEIKDVGGFVGGYCNNGRRSDIRHRSILCLDADFADDDLWQDWALVYGKASAVYSTHKHTPQKPRLRLVIPLARNVTPDEYQAVGRRVAEELGIDKFDDTSYQPQRMMYWPSCSQDGEFFFRHLDAPLLDPDEVLSTYHDWRDVTSWPMSSRVADVVKCTAAKQKDPLEKSGLIGAFCRAYTIHEAIEKFVPTYQPCDEPNRYTYTEGSTAAGVVIYDDKFSYSHHATDPASSQLVNAWDLVRLHKFSEQDADIEPDTPTGSRPSYKAMSQFAAADPNVKAQLFNDRLAEATLDYDADFGDGDEWKGKLKITEKGVIAQTIENAVIILENDTNLKGCLALNELTHNIVARKSLPWRRITKDSQWVDADDSALRYYLERVYGLTGKDRIFDAVNITATDNRFHPVCEYLDSCEWDGVKRVDTLLIDCLGAEDTAYTRAVTRKTLTAAVARVFRPGCKFDSILTIRGEQGIGKSALIAKLGGEWFSDSVTSMQGKDAYEQVQGVWLMEIGELAGLRKAEVESVKLFISKQVDRFRPAYGRRIQEFPRQCVFFGTTNETQFLRDTTGNRRFWIVETPNARPRQLLPALAALDDDTVRQIWAEAVQIYKSGEQLYLPPELEAEAHKMQEEFEEENPRVGVVAEYLDRLLPSDWDSMDIYARRMWLETDTLGEIQRKFVCIREIWIEALNGSPDKLDRYAVMEVTAIMRQIPGWKRRGKQRLTFSQHGQQRYFERIDAND